MSENKYSSGNYICQHFVMKPASLLTNKLSRSQRVMSKVGRLSTFLLDSLQSES